jgi:ATP-dependent DNA ligase
MVIVERATFTMLFSDFTDVYENLLGLNSLNEITAYLNGVQKAIGVSLDELHVWLYLLLSFDQKCKINDKHLLTIFCKIQEPNIDRKNLQDAFKAYGVAQTCSSIIKNDRPTLEMLDVYNFLNTLQTLPTKSTVLIKHFKSVIDKCDAKSLKCLINLIRSSGRNKKMIFKKKNLYLFKQVFGRKNLEEVDAMMEKLYDCRSLEGFKKCVPGQPIEPTLAQPCKSFHCIDFKKMCVELKYDGERLQIHKFADTITCYKRNLNLNNKCESLAPVINRVLSDVDDVVLDCELIGKCPKTQQIVVFDVIYLNGKCMVNKRLEERKKLLAEVMQRSEERMFLIECVVSESKEDVVDWVKTCLKEDSIEGVVIKDWDGLYEPKRKKWLKIKKSYFKNVCSADLVVVGGWKKKDDKRIIIYLVATPFFDTVDRRWKFLPVSKVKIAKHNLEHFMEEYSEELCDWLVTNEYLKQLNKIPNMVARDPLSMPVWEMEGDFIRNSENYWQCGNVISDYVSIRLPRFIKVRDDKSYLQASHLLDLKLLCCISNRSGDYEELNRLYLKNNVKVDAL